jgi:acetyltransferase-like isoleucine patch superfamily enzyme
MRRDHRPLLVRRWHEFWAQWYSRHFIQPQCEEFGDGIEIIGPRNLELFGPHISIGDYVHISTARGTMTRLCTWPNQTGEHGHLKIGNYVLLSPGVHITSAENIHIGDNVMMASHCYVSDADWHDLYDRVASPGKTAPIILEDNVWLGQGAKVLKGVRLGKNTIVAAGAVVAKSFPANSIIGGNPAKLISKLDPKKPRRTRASMFADPVKYKKTMKYIKHLQHKENSFSRWIRSMLWPDNSL